MHVKVSEYNLYISWVYISVVNLIHIDGFVPAIWRRKPGRADDSTFQCSMSSWTFICFFYDEAICRKVKWKWLGQNNIDRGKCQSPIINLHITTTAHRLTLVKGVYSLRYFLLPMRIPNLLMHVFILPNSFVVCSCIFIAIRPQCVYQVYILSVSLQFSDKMHICKSK